MPSHDRFSLFFAFFNEKSNFLPPKLFFSRKWCSIKLFLIKFRVEMTCRWKFLTAKKKSYCHFILIFHDFSTPIPSLNQGQESIFKVRECAQSILRLEKPKNRQFSHKNLKMFDFRFNTPTTFPESGSGKRFQGSGMRAIDSSHKIRGSRVIFRKKFFLMISPNKRSSLFKYCLYCFLCWIYGL